jgi:hypothetical protein
MTDPLSVGAGLSGRLILAIVLIALVWLGVWWAA